MRNLPVLSRRRKVSLIRICALLPLLLLFADEAQACSCYSTGPPCQAFWQTDAVFIGAVKSKTVVTVEIGGETKRMERRVSVIFLVDEVFRGVLGGSDVEILTGMGGADCGYGFEKGKRYLVYAQESQNKFHTDVCSRTRLLTEAKPDLMYFQSLPPEGSGASIQVKVVKRSPPTREGAIRETIPMQGVRVTAEGAGKLFEGRTSSSGQYEFKHLPPGKYNVKSESSEISRNQSETEVTVVDRACVAIEFTNNIEGVNPNPGKLVTKVF